MLTKSTSSSSINPNHINFITIIYKRFYPTSKNSPYLLSNQQMLEAYNNGNLTIIFQINCLTYPKSYNMEMKKQVIKINYQLEIFNYKKQCLTYK